MVSPSAIGLRMPTYSIEVERGQLRLFAKATGQTDPVYWNEEAARAAGHPDLPIPPTYLFCLELSGSDPQVLRDRLGIDVSRILHGEQRFRYHRLAHAGDTLSFSQRVADVYQKKDGALEFVVRHTAVTDGAGHPVADLIATTVIRND